jgi:TDG/mug DNA glycosylase family protein
MRRAALSSNTKTFKLRTPKDSQLAMAKIYKPTKEEIQAAAGKTVPDVIAPNLRVLFCGINPGLYSAAVGHHFARPGNRFWPALQRSGFTERRLTAFEEHELLRDGYGITNVVARATAGAAELSPEEFVRGGRRLRAKLKKYSPRFLAILGVGAYRAAFNQPKATLGRQPEKLEAATVWVLPNPSGLNANYQLDDLARLFRELRLAVEGGG